MEQALKKKFTETNEQMLQMMTDSSPKFIWSQFLRSFFLHLLQMNFWLLSIPIMLLVSTPQFLKNTGFLPSRQRGCMFFVVQTIQGVGYLGAVLPFLYNYFGTDDDEPKLSPIPFVMVMCLTFTRFFIISVRHGITPANFMLRLTE